MACISHSMKYLLTLAVAATLQASLAFSLIGAAAGISRTQTLRNCIIAGTDRPTCETIHSMGAQ